jgi:signal transduction histidine kinase
MASDIGEELKSKKEGTIDVQRGLVVQGDPEMIKMILFNLIENAWKYVLPNQAPVVEVGSTPEGAIYVRDHGIGFDMRYVDKVWEPFERLHRDSEFPGTGIGLANSKRIVTRHGGRMWTESKPGVGTTMYFELASRTLAGLTR